MYCMWLTACILYTYIVVFECPVWVLLCVEDFFFFSCPIVSGLFVFGQILPLWVNKKTSNVNNYTNVHTRARNLLTDFYLIKNVTSQINCSLPPSSVFVTYSVNQASSSLQHFHQLLQGNNWQGTQIYCKVHKMHNSHIASHSWKANVIKMNFVNTFDLISMTILGQRSGTVLKHLLFGQWLRSHWHCPECWFLSLQSVSAPSWRAWMHSVASLHTGSSPSAGHHVVKNHCEHTHWKSFLTVTTLRKMWLQTKLSWLNWPWQERISWEVRCYIGVWLDFIYNLSVPKQTTERNEIKVFGLVKIHLFTILNLCEYNVQISYRTQILQISWELKHWYVIHTAILETQAHKKVEKVKVC